MNIKQKLTLAFAVIASLPVILVAALIILNVRDEARAAFVDSSGREIRQVDNAMQLFFEGISQNVAYLAEHPQLAGIELVDGRQYCRFDHRIEVARGDLFALFPGALDDGLQFVHAVAPLSLMGGFVLLSGHPRR